MNQTIAPLLNCDFLLNTMPREKKKRRFVGDADGPPERVSGRGFRVPVAPGGGFHLLRVAWSSDQHI